MGKMCYTLRSCLLLVWLLPVLNLVGSTDMTVTVIWDSQDIASAGDIRAELEGMPSYYDIDDLAFNSAFIDLADVHPRDLSSRICNQLNQGCVAFMYVYSCARYSALDIIFNELAVAYTTVHVKCDMSGEMPETPYTEYFTAIEPDIGKAVNDVIMASHWDSTIILYESELMAHVDSILKYSERTQSMIFTMELAGTSISQLNEALEYLQHSVAYPRKITLVVAEQTLNTLLGLINSYNTDHDVQAVYIFEDQWLVIGEESWLASTQEQLHHVDNMATLVPGWNTDTTASTLITEAFSRILDTSQARFCNSVNITQGGASDSDCSSPYNPMFLSTLATDIMNVQTAALCETCTDFVLYTAWYRPHEEAVTRQFSITGHWHEAHGLLDLHMSAASPPMIFPNLNYGLNGRHFTVATLAWSPFITTRGNTTMADMDFQGLCVELIDELANSLNFTYEWVLPPDGEWGVPMNDSGKPDANSQWTGLVGMLQNKEVDMVGAPITITIDRALVMDFTTSFYQEYVTVIARQVDPNDSKWRLYLSPFRWRVWVCILISLPLVATVFVIFQRISPFYTKLESVSALGQFDNAFIYVFGSLFAQGGVFTPDAQSGRFVVGFWWMYIIVVVATYSGNLIAFLTVYEAKLPYNSLQEMLDYGGEFGVMQGTATYLALKDSNIPIYKEMWSRIEKFYENDKMVLSKDHHEQVMKVNASSSYGYIAEQTGFDSYLSLECELNVISEQFFPTSMGIGLQQHSQFYGILSGAITKTIESGLINRWKQKHWPRQQFCARGMVTEAGAVTLRDVQGAYYLLGLCCIFASIVLALEAVSHVMGIFDTAPIAHSVTFAKNKKPDAEEEVSTTTKVDNGIMLRGHSEVYSDAAALFDNLDHYKTEFMDINSERACYEEENVERTQLTKSGKRVDVFGRKVRKNVTYNKYGYAIEKPKETA